MSVRRMVWRLAAMLCALLGAQAAWAACNTPGACGCALSATSVSFGVYNPEDPSPSDSVGTITVICQSDPQAPIHATIVLGPGSSGSSANRTLRRNGVVLRYNLYTDPARSLVWGDDGGSGNAPVATFAAGGTEVRPFTVYARIPARQNIVPGAYQDVITVTMTY